MTEDVSRRRDTFLLYAERGVRAFGAGYVAILLALYLPVFGLDAFGIGGLLSLATAVGLVSTFLFMRRVDVIGRRRVLAISGLFRVLSGLALAFAPGLPLLIVAALFAGVPPGDSGLSSTVEQAIVGTYPAAGRAALFGRYGLMGSAATALGLLAAGIPQLLAHSGVAPLTAERAMMGGYAAIGLIVILLSLLMTPAVELKRTAPAGATPARPSLFGLGRSHGMMTRMASLFVADSFGSSMVTTSLLAFFLHVHFGMDAGTLAALFFGIRVLATVSYPLAIWISRPLGLINTAVYTHIPSSLLLIAVAFVPSAWLAAVFLLARGLLVEMDVPTRQAFISHVVAPEERAAAAGITTMGSQLGTLLGPVAGGALMAAASELTFVLGGVVKIAYDLTLWVNFRHVSEAEAAESA